MRPVAGTVGRLTTEQLCTEADQGLRFTAVHETASRPPRVQTGTPGFVEAVDHRPRGVLVRLDQTRDHRDAVPARTRPTALPYPCPCGLLLPSAQRAPRRPMRSQHQLLREPDPAPAFLREADQGVVDPGDVAAVGDAGHGAGPGVGGRLTSRTNASASWWMNWQQMLRRERLTGPVPAPVGVVGRNEHGPCCSCLFLPVPGVCSCRSPAVLSQAAGRGPSGRSSPS